MTGPLVLDVLTPTGRFSAARREPVVGVDGAVVAELCLSPRLLVSRSLRTLHGVEELPARRRVEALQRAAELFLGEVDGVTLDDHERRVSRVTGLALPVVRAASRRISDSAARADCTARAAAPSAVHDGWRAVEGSGVVWARRGRVLAVLAPGNHPATHSVWLEALALGYHVAIRPSVREPFTAHRLVTVLRLAGFGAGRVVLLPTEHGDADLLVQGADRSVVYGDDRSTRMYRGRDDVLVQGPGRSALLLDVETTAYDLDVAVATAVESVTGFGGTACVNASTVFVSGGPGVLETVARRLRDDCAELPVRARDAADAILPSHPAVRAKSLLDRIQELRADAGVDSDVAETAVAMADGSVVLRPVVTRLTDATCAAARAEMPFPCVWVVPWSRSTGVAVLGDALTVTVLTGDDELVDALLAEPTIKNVHVGPVPTTRMAPELPHDGFLAEFLMRSATVIRAVGA